MGVKNKRAIFLSAGIPDPSKSHFMGEADAAAVSALVSALLFVSLGRRPIVWGGHPAITPMIWAYAEGLGVDYGKWVTLYQSKFFKDDFPEETAYFKNVILTEAVSDDLSRSLAIMRYRMFTENSFESAIFAGGMRGIFDEYYMLTDIAPNTRIIPIISTGGAAEKLGDEIGYTQDLERELDYVALLFDKLSIDPNEPRSQAES